MRRGEEKELEAGKAEQLFLSETPQSRNGNAIGRFARSELHPAFRKACHEIGLILLLWALLCCVLCAVSCGAGGSPTVGPAPPPSPSVTVNVTPGAATVLLGNTVGFTASVSGTSNTAVEWTVNGIPGGNTVMGSISPTGSYQAPAILPSPANVQIVATSEADAASSANATATVMSDVRVQLAPASASVELGAGQSFAATIVSAGHPATTVSWSLAGPGCAGTACGTIGADGSYTAPGILPTPPSVALTATSVADPSQSATASIGLTSRFTLSAQGPASVAAGATAQFTATIQPVPGSNPATGVNWSVSGAGCATGPNACGTISAAGAYTAPSVPPQPPQITVTATSVADPSKTASVTTTIVNTHVLGVSPANATVALEQTEAFAATLDGAATQAVTWSVNGIPGGNTAVGTISNSPSMNGLYLAPVNMPAARSVTITATSTAYPALSSSVTLQLTSNISVSISPTTAVLIPGAGQSFTASVAQTSNPQVGWTVNGVPNGSAAFGQICVSGSNPCTPPPAATPPGSVDYLAPGALPSPPQVTVEAVSVADPTRFAAASVTITPQISVNISPPALTLPPQQVQTFTATVLGVADQNVTWDVNGSINGSIADGLICLPASSPCQAPNGATAGPVEYRAPDTPPTPNVVSVRATSEASSTAQGVAQVTISTGPYITALVPASVFAGAQGSFGLRVSGVQFTASQPGPGAAILINGTPRATNCPSATDCDATLDPADVSSAGSIPVSVENADGTASNTVSLIVVAPQATETVVSLDASAPVAAGMDIIVVEPTLAGSDPPEQLSLLEIGQVDPATGTCMLGAPPLLVSPPSSGSAVVQICVFGTALDQVTQVTFSAPATPDLSASNLNSSLGSLLLEFDLAVPADAAPGARTLFLATANQDVAALTAAVEVQ